MILLRILKKIIKRILFVIKKIIPPRVKKIYRKLDDKMASLEYIQTTLYELIFKHRTYAHTYSRHYKPKECTLKVAVVAHIFYDYLVQEFVSYFKNIPVPFDIYISTKPESQEKIAKIFIQHFPNHKIDIRSVENRGRDMGPFTITFKDVYENYDLVCWTHSKVSRYYKKVFYWRSYLLKNLLGSKRIVENILCDFQNDKKLGFIFPEIFPSVRGYLHWGENFKIAQNILLRMGISIDEKTPIEFSAGTMFWFRPIAINQLFKINLQLDEFEEKSELKLDGTLAHAMERIFLILAKENGYHWKRVLFKF